MLRRGDRHHADDSQRSKDGPAAAVKDIEFLGIPLLPVVMWVRHAGRQEPVLLDIPTGRVPDAGLEEVVLDDPKVRRTDWPGLRTGGKIRHAGVLAG